MKKILLTLLFIISLSSVCYCEEWTQYNSEGNYFYSRAYGTAMLQEGINQMQTNEDYHWVFYDVKANDYFPFKAELDANFAAQKADIAATGGANLLSFADQYQLLTDLKKDWYRTYQTLDLRKAYFNDHYNVYIDNITNFPNGNYNYGLTFDDMAKFWIDKKLSFGSPLAQSDIQYMNETNYRISDIPNAIKVSDVRTHDRQ